MQPQEFGDRGRISEYGDRLARLFGTARTQSDAWPRRIRQAVPTRAQGIHALHLRKRHSEEAATQLG